MVDDSNRDNTTTLRGRVSNTDSNATSSAKTLPAQTTKKNVYTTKPLPIIFVPGVMGSRLAFATGNKWDPESTWEMSHWIFTDQDKLRIEMNHANPATLIQTGDNRKGDELSRYHYGEVVYSFYVKFIKKLHALGMGEQGISGRRCPVYAAGYDWRQSNADSAAKVAERVQTALSNENAEQFVLISHSMGGLVSRWMLKNNSGLSGKLKAAIHVTQPVLGAVVAYRRFLTGAISEYDGGGVMDRVIETIMGNTPAKYAMIMSGMRGPIELMPNNALKDTQGNPWLKRDGTAVGGDVYTIYQAGSSPGIFDEAAFIRGKRKDLEEEYMMASSYGGSFANMSALERLIAQYEPQWTRQAHTIGSDLRSRVGEAKNFHTQLGDYKHPNTWAVYSTGRKTDVAVSFQSAAKPEDLDRQIPGVKPDRRDEGDGTVPERSGAALYPGVGRSSGEISKANRQYKVSDVEHAAAFSDATTTQLVIDLLTKILAPD